MKTARLAGFRRSQFALAVLVGLQVVSQVPSAQVAQSCVRSKGYWTTHLSVWPVASLTLGNAGNPQHRYGQSELVALLDQSPKGDASVVLAAQLIAAKLNIASGSNPAPVAETLTRADALLGTFTSRLPYRVAAGSPLGSDMTNAGAVLELYNTGQLPGSCGPTNRAPLADAGADQIARVGSLVTLDGSRSSDADGDPLTYRWSFLGTPSDSLAVLSNPAAAMPTFVVDEPGTYRLQLIVNDGKADSVADTVAVSTSNTAPVAEAGPDQTTRVGAQATLDGSGSTDPDGDPLTYSWIFTSTPAGSQAVLSNPTAVGPSFIVDVPGAYVVRLIVSDGVSSSDADTVTISTINSAPVADAGMDTTARVGETVTLDGSRSRDVDGDPLTFAWSLVARPDASVAVVADPTSVTPHLAIDRAGEYIAQLTVNDGTVSSAADTVVVSTVNSRPVANAGADGAIVVGELAPLDGSASSDVDGNALTYSWALTTRPPGSAASLSNPTLVNPTFTPDVPGAYVAQLIVNDGALASDPDTATFTTANRPPVANPGIDKTVALGSTVHFDGTASSDPDGDPLTFQWSLLSSPTGSTAVLDSPTTADPSFVADLRGNYLVQLIVNDGVLASEPRTVTISTENSAPVAAAGADQTVAVDTTVRLDGTASFDPDGTPLTFAWSLLSRPAGSAAALSTPSSATPTFLADRSGIYVVQLLVGDGTLLSAPDTLTVTASSGADLAIAFVNAPDGTHTPGAAVAFSVRVENLGPSAADQVTARFQLPGGYALASATLTAGVYDTASGDWTIGPLDAAAAAQLDIQATVNAAGSLALAATVTGSSQTDPDPSNDAATAPGVNRPPIADAGADRSVARGASVTLNGNGSSDPDGDPLSFQWTMTSRPPASGAVLAGGGSASPSFVADTVGDYVVQLVVIDNRGGSSLADAVTISATGSSRAPIITSTAPANGVVGELYAYDVTVSDDDAGESFAFSLPLAPAGMTIDAAGRLRWIPLGTQTGSINVAVHVRDSAGLLAAQGFSVLVAPGSANRAPKAADDAFDARTGDALSVPAPGVLANDADPDGNRLTVRALSQPTNGVAQLNGDGSLVYTPFTFQEGELVLADRVNLAHSVPGATVAASTSTIYRTNLGGPESAVDGSPGTSWRTLSADAASFGVRSRTGALPFIEVTFPQNVDVTDLEVMGHRDPVLANDKIFAGKFTLFDAEDAELFDSGVVDLPLPDRDGRATVPGLFERSRNLGRAMPGVIYRASSFASGQEPALAFDGNLRTEWSSQFGTAPPQFLEAEFPADVAIRRVRIFGNRNIFGQDFLSFIVEVFDGGGSTLFATTVNVTPDSSDVTVEVGGIGGARRVRVTGTVEEISGARGAIAELEIMSAEPSATRLNGLVRRARFTDTADASVNVGLAEFRVMGSTLMRRQLRPEPNVAQLLPTTVVTSSFHNSIFGFANAPENAIDGTVRNWYAASGAPGEFLQLEFPLPVTIDALEMTNPSATPDGFGSSLTMNCSGTFVLQDTAGATLFDSGLVNQPSGDVNGAVTFTLAVPHVAGVKRFRYTSAGCGVSFPPGFSEVRVFGEVDVPRAPVDVRRKYQALVDREVHSTPIVANLTDDNGDGLIDQTDTPDIAVAVENPQDQLTGEIKVISGDDGRELMTLGAPTLVSPWAELAVGDIDDDGRPEIIGVHTDRNHLVAFDSNGNLKWLSDANPMPQFNLGSGIATGAVAIANLDANGPPEIIIGASVFDSQGHLIGDGRTLGGTTGGVGLRSAMPAVADVDLDGMPELVAGPTAYRLAGGALSIAWQRTDRLDGYVAIANLDDDPQAEIAVVANGLVYVLNHDGTDAPFWNAPSNAPVPLPGGGQGGPPTIADLDGDGVPEIGVAGAGYYVVFNRDGTIRWKAAISDRTSNGTGSTVFDLDGDGSVEVIYRDEANLRIYRGSDGILLARQPIGSSTWSEMPVVADVDNDGHADLVVTSDRFFDDSPASTGIVVLQDVANRWVRTRRIWNQASYHVTNINEDATVPVAESPHWLLPGLNGFRLNVPPVEPDGDSTDSFQYMASDGTLESNVATVRLGVRKPNSAPRILSTGGANGAIGVLYTYAVRAADPDGGDILTFSLPTAPDGMAIDAASGLIHWTPAAAQLGLRDVVVKVQDVRGLFALQGYSVQVGAAVAVPDVVGRSQTEASGVVVAATLQVGRISTRNSPTVPVDAVISQNPAAGTLVAPSSGVDLVLSIGPAPAGTVPDVVGLQQASAQLDIAAAGFTIGSIASQFNTTVAAGIVLSQSPPAGTQATTGSPVGLVVSAGVPPADRDQDHDGFTGGQGDCNDTDPSIHPGALDPPGDGIDQNCNGRDSIGGDSTPPVAAIASPDDLATITMPADIVGTATDANFLRYTLSFTDVDSTAYTTIGSGTTPTEAGVLGRLDPTLLENGLYRVRLSVEDIDGEVSVDERVYRVDGQAKIGNLRLSFTDLSVPVAGIPITITRTYDSRVKSRQDFGIGWTLDISRGRYRHNRTPGLGWIIQDQPFLGTFLPCIGGSLETRSHLTEVRLSDRESYTFALDIKNGNLGITGACEGTASFRLLDGTRPGATLEILDGTSVIYLRGGDDTLLDMNAFLEGTNRVYDPQRVRLTLVDGTAVDLERRGGITRLADLNGNELQFSAQGIIHSSGKSISFARDAQDRITRITDPMGGSLTYRYDDRGDLTTFADQAGNSTTFVYDEEHNLSEIRDALGRPARAEYDADGRLVALVDAQGHRTTFSHDLDAQREVLTDRLGHSSILDYDDQGNVLRRVDPLGNATVFSYDARNNLLSETDPLGHARTYTYDDRDNPLTITDQAGHATVYTYNGFNQVLTALDPRSGLATRAYDSRGNLLVETDPTGGSVSYGYDTHGRPIRMSNSVGATWTYGYDAAGHIVTTTTPTGDLVENVRDASGNILMETRHRLVDGLHESAITRFTYDALGRRTQIVNAVGAEHTATYTATGQVAASTSPCCGATSAVFDDQDRPIRVSFADGTSESITYDAEGRELTRTDRAGRTTRYTYDPLGRLLTTNFPDGATVTATYDAAGRKTAQADELGRVTRFTYDAKGRLTSTRDPLGGTTQTTYDEAGNVASTTDRNGRVTSFSYDGANRLLQTTFPDGTSASIAYDSAGRRVGETDQAGNLTRFEYDLRGALTQVIDPLGNATRHMFNELDRRVSQTDPLGNTTRFAYDVAGRRTLTTLPLGQTEAVSYTVGGLVEWRRDFNGRTTRYAYDALGQLVTRTLPDGEVHRFTHTLTGRIASVGDGTGVTTFGYDDRDRPTLVRRPDATEIRYTYDAAGNRTGLATPAGDITYAYDANDRLIALTDFAGQANVFDHDAEGNVTRLRYSNGLVTSYAYDSLNRLTGVSHALGSQALRSFQYTLGPAGNRTRVLEDSGRTVDYAYDALFRLTSETINAPGQSTISSAYTYDAAGNRTSRSGSSGSVTYVYDANSRLRQSGTAAFAYDGNGSLLSALDPTGLTSYEYDGLNRLVRSTSAAGITQYAYDAMGHRVRKADAAGSTDYLIDPFGVGDLSDVLRETNAAGPVDYVYAFGSPLSMRRPEATSFYAHDARMSTRMLVDAGGAVTDRYDYDAFGNVLSRQGATPNERLFDGQQFDPSLRFYHLRARYYDPTAGRFTARDPFPGLIFEPSSLHPYTYAGNDPVNKRDPSGQFTLGEQLTIAATVGILNGLAYAVQDFYYYRSFEGAFDAGADAALSYFSLAMDMLGLGSIVREGVLSVARGLGEALAARPFIAQVLRNAGKNARTILTESAERVLCRFNNVARCVIAGVPVGVSSTYRLTGAAIRGATEVVGEAPKTLADATYELGKMLGNGAKEALKEADKLQKLGKLP